MTIVALVASAIIAGQAVSIHIAHPATSLASLKTVPVPGPDNLGNFIKDKVAAVALGKAFFWDMQVGSDGITACASCHFHAGADSRAKNQLNPGTLRVNADRSDNADNAFNTGGANYTLKPKDFPFHKLANPNDRQSTTSDSNDVASSQGIFNSTFIDINPNSAEDQVTYDDDPVFNVGGTEVRRVEPRNTPTVINSVFNFRNFWDGRAQNDFNGLTPFGSRDPNAFVMKATAPKKLEPVKVSLKNSSLASVAVGPPLSSFEMSAANRKLPDISQKLSRRIRKNGTKLLRRERALAQQLVHPQDSVLGSFSRWPKPGLNRSYSALIKSAFQPQWWQSNVLIEVNEDGKTDEYALIDYNFGLFFGLATQEYLSTLVSDNTPFDRFLAGNSSALTKQQQEGFALFQTKGKCINCHGGTELTNASVTSIQEEALDRMDGEAPVYDNGFNNTGVRPTWEDLAIGGIDPFGNPLSLSRLAKLGKFTDPNLDPPFNTSEPVVADGGFKVPGLRNVELTAPYFHNGGQLTLRQVVDFYNRGGDFDNGIDMDPDIQNLELTEQEKDALVAFLQGLTDQRVRDQKAPFDHPQLFMPNGHPGNQTSVTSDSDGKATDSLLELPAVGRKGGSPLPNFLTTSRE